MFEFVSAIIKIRIKRKMELKLYSLCCLYEMAVVKCANRIGFHLDIFSKELILNFLILIIKLLHKSIYNSFVQVYYNKFLLVDIRLEFLVQLRGL